MLMTELPQPLTVRRFVSFSRAVYDGEVQVEDIGATLVSNWMQVEAVQEMGRIAVIVDAAAHIRDWYAPDVLVDGIMAKKNTGTKRSDAPRVIALGPGFTAGDDCHFVIETKRGTTLGQIITAGCALENTGIPGNVGGYARERLLRAAAGGILEPQVCIGDLVQAGDVVAYTAGQPVRAQIDGVVRGMLPAGLCVSAGLKIGDVDPRGIRSYCYLISDKAKCIGRSVVQATEMAIP